jgi:hypothetical protein
MLKNNKCEYRNDEADKKNLNKKVNLIDFNKINGMYYINFNNFFNSFKIFL